MTGSLTRNVSGLGALNGAIDGSRTIAKKVRRAERDQRVRVAAIQGSWICPACGNAVNDPESRAEHMVAEYAALRQTLQQVRALIGPAPRFEPVIVTQETDTISTTTASEILGLTMRRLGQLCAQGDIESARRDDGRHWLMDRAEIERLARARARAMGDER